MYISLWENYRGHPDNISFMQFSTKIDGFEQKESQGFENSYNSYEQYPLEKFFIFTIYQNYTLALSHREFPHLVQNRKYICRRNIWCIQYSTSLVLTLPSAHLSTMACMLASRMKSSSVKELHCLTRTSTVTGPWQAR